MKNRPAIRIAGVNDAEEVSRLLRSAMLTYCADSGISASMLEAMTESIDSVADRISEQTCLVAEQDGKIVGTICIKEVPNPMIYMFSDKTCEYLLNAGHSFYISRFAVKQSYRKTGLGIDLITKAVQLARNSGAECILLHSAATNKNMVEFYGKRGFELIDSENSRGYMRGLFASKPA
ncbi:GNAT family N-acetyltransferase [Butyrivibrio sp. AE2032]|uniref:GNAT family N-acetyltransferase n=1 Tax=Butyrivibrio sp. AE2032 TaxID=1458463 RepID=UPI00054F187C|nr:GNAT family N-acetyltransferase [Butyrivibrio sp. AE2032]